MNERYTIYLVLSNSGTIVSRTIGLYTRKEFNHISVSFEKELTNMYSFGRKKLKNPLFGGFIEESKDSEFFKYFEDTACEVFELEVNKQQYTLLKEKIDLFIQNKDDFKYNTLGILCLAFNIELKREKHYFCSQFVCSLLEDANIIMNKKEYLIPEEIKKVDNIKLIYKGPLKNYQADFFH